MRYRLHLLAFTGAIALCLEPASTLAQPPDSAAAVRTRLSHAYLRLEAVWRDRSPRTDDDLARANRAFDAASLAFFAGRFAQATATVDSLARSLEPSGPRWEALGDSVRALVASLPALRLTVMADGVALPYRRWLPPGSAPAPVIVALHGAGGDEHMFVHAYGAGRLVSLARARGAVVISPSTTVFMRTAGALEALLAAVEQERPIDRTRVVVIGHSMGAGAAWRVATEQPSRVAALACLAGNCGTPPPGATTLSLPPVLVVAGALDPLANADRLQQAADAARGAGVRLTFQRRDHYGHTLLVGDALPQVMDWLWEQIPR